MQIWNASCTTVGTHIFKAETKLKLICFGTGHHRIGQAQHPMCCRAEVE